MKTVTALAVAGFAATVLAAPADQCKACPTATNTYQNMEDKFSGNGAKACFIPSRCTVNGLMATTTTSTLPCSVAGCCANIPTVTVYKSNYECLDTCTPLFTATTFMFAAGCKNAKREVPPVSIGSDGKVPHNVGGPLHGLRPGGAGIKADAAAPAETAAAAGPTETGTPTIARRDALDDEYVDPFGYDPGAYHFVPPRLAHDKTITEIEYQCAHWQELIGGRKHADFNIPDEVLKDRGAARMAFEARRAAWKAERLAEMAAAKAGAKEQAEAAAKQQAEAAVDQAFMAATGQANMAVPAQETTKQTIAARETDSNIEAAGSERLPSMDPGHDDLHFYSRPINQHVPRGEVEPEVKAAAAAPEVAHDAEAPATTPAVDDAGTPTEELKEHWSWQKTWGHGPVKTPWHWTGWPKPLKPLPPILNPPDTLPNGSGKPEAVAAAVEEKPVETGSPAPVARDEDASAEGSTNPHHKDPQYVPGDHTSVALTGDHRHKHPHYAPTGDHPSATPVVAARGEAEANGEEWNSRAGHGPVVVTTHKPWWWPPFHTADGVDPKFTTVPAAAARDVEEADNAEWNSRAGHGPVVTTKPGPELGHGPVVTTHPWPPKTVQRTDGGAEPAAPTPVARDVNAAEGGDNANIPPPLHFGSSLPPKPTDGRADTRPGPPKVTAEAPIAEAVEEVQDADKKKKPPTDDDYDGPKVIPASYTGQYTAPTPKITGPPWAKGPPDVHPHYSRDPNEPVFSAVGGHNHSKEAEPEATTAPMVETEKKWVDTLGRPLHVPWRISGPHGTHGKPTFTDGKNDGKKGSDKKVDDNEVDDNEDETDPQIEKRNNQGQWVSTRW